MLKIKGEYFSDRNIATFYLFAMTVQFLYLEGWQVSMLKVSLMAISPIIWLLKKPSLTKATFWSAAYMLVTTFTLYLQWNNVRSSTLWYSLLFFSMFNMYYSLIYVNRAFTLDYYIKLIRAVIFAFAGCLVLQQIFVTVGIRYFPPFNLMAMPYYTPFRLNTLAIEPSHAARMLTVACYVLLKLLEVKNGGKQAIQTLFMENRKTFSAFLYTMVCMGSGTAFVGLAILSLYFVDRRYILPLIPVGVALFYIVTNVEYEPLQRFLNVAEVAVEMDNAEMQKVDNSAASRTNLLFSMINNFDLNDPKLLFGHGPNANWYNPNATHPVIYNYGLASYACKLGIFFSCCWNGLFSLPVLMFVLLFSFNIGNVAYGWACLMMLATLKYFQTHRECDDDTIDNNPDL